MNRFGREQIGSMFKNTINFKKELEAVRMYYYENGAMVIKLDYELPEYPKMETCYRRAPRREAHLSECYGRV